MVRVKAPKHNQRYGRDVAEEVPEVNEIENEEIEEREARAIRYTYKVLRGKRICPKYRRPNPKTCRCLY